MTGDDLKSKRLAKGWSQRELARRSGLHHGAVQYWERQPILDVRGYAVLRMHEALGWRNLVRESRARHGVLPNEEETDRFVSALVGLSKPLAGRLVDHLVRCGAKTRQGMPCRAQSEPGRRRCRLHGGLSTGPKTRQGRARVAEAQKRRWQRWRRSACS